MSDNGDVKKLADLIEDIEFAMLTTVDSEGCLRSRPMATQKSKFDGALWFFTDVESAKAHEIERDRHVNLSYANPDKQRYVSVSGVARLVQDKAKAKQLWNPVYKAWFPDGVDDPNLSLIQVQVEKAEFWDSPSSKVVQLVGFAKALATGERLKNAGDHEKLSF